MPSDLTPDEWADLPELIDAATPGPWETGCLCDPESTCRCRYIYGNDGRMGAVASVHLNVDEHDDNPTEPEAIANQRLIALAPSLARAALAERARAEAAEAERERLREAVQAVLDGAVMTYRARNGQEVSIEADDGEACLIVHSDLMHDLRCAALGTEANSKV